MSCGGVSDLRGAEVGSSHLMVGAEGRVKASARSTSSRSMSPSVFLQRSGIGRSSEQL